MSDAYRIMSRDTVTQAHFINKGDLHIMLLTLTSQLQQALGNISN